MDWIPPTQKKQPARGRCQQRFIRAALIDNFHFCFSHHKIDICIISTFIYPLPRMCGSVLDFLYTPPLLRFGTVGRFGEILVISPILTLVRHNFSSSALHASQNHMVFTHRDPVTGHGVAR